MSRPTITVVLCCSNYRACISDCLRSLVAQQYPSFEILIVDNSPGDARIASAADMHGARYTCEPRIGLSRARNHGALQSSAEVVAYIDDDAVAEPGWLAALGVEFSDPTVATVTGRIRAANGREAERLWSESGGAPLGADSRIVFDRNLPQWYGVAAFGGLGNGGNMAFRRNLFACWPGFDERLGRGTLIGAGEENEAFYQLIKRGHKIVYTPDAVVLHPLPGDHEAMRERYLGATPLAGAYLTLQLVEHPEHRVGMLLYMFKRGLCRLKGVLHRDQASRNYSGTSVGVRSFWRTAGQWMRGPFLYWRSRALQSSFAADASPRVPAVAKRH
jgi:glycosyltransferase involved in cell wall biosynthesis